MGPARVRRRAGCVGRVVDVLAVNVDGVGDKRGATVTTAGVPLLEPEELDLGLDTIDEVETHCEDVCGGFAGAVVVESCGRDRDQQDGSPSCYILSRWQGCDNLARRAIRHVEGVFGQPIG